MKIQIEVETHDSKLLYDLMGDQKRIEIGKKPELPDDIILFYEGSKFKKAFNFPDVLNFTLTFGAGATSSLLANWLYEKLKGRATKLRMDHEEMEINESKIERIVERVIQKIATKTDKITK